MVPAFERYRDIIPDYSAFLNSVHLPVPTYLRVNTLRIEREKFRHVMAERGYRLTPVAGVPEAFQWESPGTPGSTLEYFRGFPAFSVRAVDSTAAGDAFNGALATALAEGRAMEQAIPFANAAGACATTRRGAQESLPDRDAIAALVSSGK